MGKSEQNIKKNTMVRQGMILILANIIVRFFGFVYRIPLTSILGDEGNGIYSVSFNIYYFFLVLSSASMPAVISKLVAERVAKKQYADAHKVFKVALYISSTLGFFFMMFLLVFGQPIANLFNHEAYLSILVLAPTVFVVAILSVYRGYFQGLKNTVPTAISQVIEQIFNAIVSLVGAYYLVKISLAHGSAGSTLGTLAGAFSGLLVVLFIYSRHRRYIIKRVGRSKSSEYSFDIAKDIVTTAFPIILGTGIFSITLLIDASMISSRLASIGVYTSSEITALYGQLSAKFLVLTNLPISIATVFSASVIPNISEMRVNKDKKGLNKSINLAIKTVMLIAVPSAFGLTILAKEIYQFLYPAYPDGYMLMYVGGVSIIIIAFNQIIVSVLQGLNRLYLPLIATVISIVVKIILNYLLIAIPTVNIVGAVISTVISYIVFLFIDLYFFKKVVGTKIIYTVVLIKPFVASSVMGVVTYFSNKMIYALTSNNTFALFTSIVLSGAVYFLTLVYIRSVDEALILKVPKGHIIVRALKKVKVLK